MFHQEPSQLGLWYSFKDYQRGMCELTFEQVVAAEGAHEFCILDVRPSIETEPALWNSINVSVKELENFFKCLTNEDFIRLYGRCKPCCDDPILLIISKTGSPTEPVDILQRLGYTNLYFYRGNWDDCESPKSYSEDSSLQEHSLSDSSEKSAAKKGCLGKLSSRIQKRICTQRASRKNPSCLREEESPPMSEYVITCSLENSSNRNVHPSSGILEQSHQADTHSGILKTPSQRHEYPHKFSPASYKKPSPQEDKYPRPKGKECILTCSLKRSSLKDKYSPPDLSRKPSQRDKYPSGHSNPPPQRNEHQLTNSLRQTPSEDKQPPCSCMNLQICFSRESFDCDKPPSGHSKSSTQKNKHLLTNSPGESAPGVKQLPCNCMGSQSRFSRELSHRDKSPSVLPPKSQRQSPPIDKQPPRSYRSLQSRPKESSHRDKSPSGYSKSPPQKNEHLLTNYQGQSLPGHKQPPCNYRSLQSRFPRESSHRDKPPSGYSKSPPQRNEHLLTNSLGQSPPGHKKPPCSCRSSQSRFPRESSHRDKSPSVRSKPPPQTNEHLIKESLLRGNYPPKGYSKPSPQKFKDLSASQPSAQRDSGSQQIVECIPCKLTVVSCKAPNNSSTISGKSKPLTKQKQQSTSSSRKSGVTGKVPEDNRSSSTNSESKPSTPKNKCPPCKRKPAEEEDKRNNTSTSIVVILPNSSSLTVACKSSSKCAPFGNSKYIRNR